MKFTLSWLKEHLETTASVDEIAEKLTMIGLEIEEVVDPSKNLDGFIVGEVLSVEKHPDADKLNLLKVNSGKETLQIVCGATNCEVGMKGVLALVGTTIPVYNEKLKLGKIRGMESQGMLCSERELLLGDNHDGIIHLPKDSKVGDDVKNVVSVDPVFDIAVTPNRGDCLAVRGVARDLAAAGLGTLRPLEAKPVNGTFKSPIDVSLSFPNGEERACPLFVGRYVKGVKNGESPKWLKDKLAAIGMRPISALVDITNYINIGLARPLHVFDAKKLKGNITVRFAKNGEKLVALDENTYELEEGMIGVCDDEGVQALGGIMGGEPTGCTRETTDVFIESALFDAAYIARAGRKLQIDSDSRYRFERNVDPESTIIGSELATALVLELCGGEASEAVIAGSVPKLNQKISFRLEKIKNLIGIDIAKDEVLKIFEKLGFVIEKDEKDTLLISVPSWRKDVEGEHDLVEEVIRIYGLDNIPFIPMPRSPMPKSMLTTRQKNLVSIRRRLAARGMNETINYAFTSSIYGKLFRGEGKEPVMLANPISSELDEMRPSLLANLVAAVSRNVARGFADVILFEIGPEFYGYNPEEQRDVAAGVRSGKNINRHWAEKARNVDVFDVKADALDALASMNVSVDGIQVTREAPNYYHTGRSGTLKLGKAVLGHFGEIHPMVLKAMDIKVPLVAFEVYPDNAPPTREKKGKTKKLLKVSAFQALSRDFAFIVDENVEVGLIVQAAKGVDRNLISEIRVFDVFSGGSLEYGKKSVAIEVVIQPFEKTLSDAEIDSLSSKIIAAVNKRTGGEIRK